MPSKLFHALVVTGASLTGSIGIVVVPAAATALSGCDSSHEHGVPDMGLVFTGHGDMNVDETDMGFQAIGAIDMHPDDLAPIDETDGGAQ